MLATGVMARSSSANLPAEGSARGAFASRSNANLAHRGASRGNNYNANSNNSSNSSSINNSNNFTTNTTTTNISSNNNSKFTAIIPTMPTNNIFSRCLCNPYNLRRLPNSNGSISISNSNSQS